MKTIAKATVFVFLVSATFAVADEGQSESVEWQTPGFGFDQATNDDIRRTDLGPQIDVSNLGLFHDPDPIVISIEMGSSENTTREPGIVDVPLNFVRGIINSILDWAGDNATAIVIAIKVVIIVRFFRD